MIAIIEHTTIFLSWLGTLTAGLLGVYALAFKTMKDVNRKVDVHVSDTKVHTDPEHPTVSDAVCKEVQKRNEVHFDTLASGQTDIKKTLDRVWEKMNQ